MKKKKRKKRKLLRTSSSRSTPGRARRRRRQWHAHGWFSVLAVFPSYAGRPKLPGIMAGMDPKDCIALFVSGMCKARFTGDSALRAVFLSFLS